MFRVFFCMLSAMTWCEASLLTESVRCGSYSQTTTTSLPMNGASELRCDVNGVTALSHPIAGLVVFEVVAVQAGATPTSPPGDVEASIHWTGTWIWSVYPDLNQIPPQVAPAFWSLCITETGSGTRSASGSAGGYTVGGPCDFAHSIAFPASNSVPLMVDLFAEAHGNGDENVFLAFKGFDLNGAPVAMTSFSLAPVADSPEPSTALPLGLVLGVVARARAVLRKRCGTPLPDARGSEGG